MVLADPVTFQHHSVKKEASKIKNLSLLFYNCLNPVKSDIGRRKHRDNFWTVQKPSEGHSSAFKAGLPSIILPLTLTCLFRSG